MSAATRIVRTFASGNQKKWTMSFWMKVSRINYTDGGGGASRQVFGQTLSNYCRFIITGSTQKIQFYESQGMDLKPSRVFRDFNGWYHIVVTVDTAQATASNRVKIYINGEQVTNWDTETYPAQNADLHFNKSGTHEFGGSSAYGGYEYFNGLLSHIHFTDGYAYAASDFGSTDSTTGEWKINTSPSVSYGTTGFWILKDGNSLTDQSTNSNDFTVSTGTLTKTEDCPSNVFATLNPLVNIGSSTTYSQGNNTVSTSDANYRVSPSTLAVSSGKYYMEFKAVSGSFGSIDAGVGILQTETNFNTSSQNLNAYPGGYSYGSLGKVREYNASDVYTASTYTDGDIIGIALDMDNNKLYFHKNGTYQNSGVPTSGSTGTGAVSITSGKEYYFACSTISAGGTKVFSANFGNGYFGTTAVSSAGSNASGHGIFEYDVPTGYTSLSTKGLNE